MGEALAQFRSTNSINLLAIFLLTAI